MCYTPTPNYLCCYRCVTHQHLTTCAVLLQMCVTHQHLTTVLCCYRCGPCPPVSSTCWRSAWSPPTCGWRSAIPVSSMPSSTPSTATVVAMATSSPAAACCPRTRFPWRRWARRRASTCLGFCVCWWRCWRREGRRLTCVAWPWSGCRTSCRDCRVAHMSLWCSPVWLWSGPSLLKVGVCCPPTCQALHFSYNSYMGERGRGDAWCNG